MGWREATMTRNEDDTVRRAPSAGPQPVSRWGREPFASHSISAERSAKSKGERLAESGGPSAWVDAADSRQPRRSGAPT
jgi:hypothetical protein